MQTTQNDTERSLRLIQQFSSSVVATMRLSTAPVKTECEYFDLAALLDDVSNSTRLIVGSKPVAVMSVSPTEPVIVHSDSVTMRRIVTALMHKAAKLTVRGRISLILVREDGHIRLTVADTGRGMSREQIDSLYTCADCKYAEEVYDDETFYPDTQLVKLVQKLRGDMTISSKVGAGTIVEISLPLGPSDHKAEKIAVKQSA